MLLLRCKKKLYVTIKQPRNHKQDIMNPDVGVRGAEPGGGRQAGRPRAYHPRILRASAKSCALLGLAWLRRRCAGRLERRYLTVLRLPQ